MKRALFLAPLALLSSCALLPAMMGMAPPAPASFANRTNLDEQLATTVELAYQTEAELLLTAAKSGLLDAPTKERLRGLDNQAYRAVLATRAAYKAGNAPDYFTAAADARNAISAVVSAVKGN